MLDLLEEYGVEALFIGHVHNFWFYRYAETDCYLLPSTAFVRLDYSEMYRIPPSPDSEFGRNDKAKLGYFVVHVHEGGHVCDVIRTYGTEAAKGSPDASGPARIAAVHPRLNRRGDFGFDMRQNWMEIVEIPPTGGLDEFDRKEVRNDYPLMALWEMGVKKVRVPLRDLLVPDNIDRMRMLKAHGHEFTLFSFGDPAPRHTRTSFRLGRSVSTGRPWSGILAASARWRRPSRCPSISRDSAPSPSNAAKRGNTTMPSTMASWPMTWAR
jgi:hypothetical protein